MGTKIPDATIEKGNDGKLYLKNFYTQLPVAKKEIWRRWRDEELKRRVEKFLEGNLEKFFFTRPKAILARFLATPDIEFFRFLNQSKKLDLDALCLEYLDDIFLTANKDKYHLGKMFFYNGKGKNNGNKITSKKIIDLELSSKKPIKKIKTFWEENFIQFHHRILNSSIPKIYKLLDVSKHISEWGKNNKKNNVQKNYCLYYLTLSIGHGILLENYLLNNDREESAFVKNKIVPTFNYLKNKFKVKPIISTLMPTKLADDIRCWCYHEMIQLNFDTDTQKNNNGL